MNDKSKNKQTAPSSERKKTERGGLRLVVDNDPKPEAPKSPIVTFMGDYADAIDREIERILKL